MFNWFNLSDAATVRSATAIDKAGKALEAGDDLSFQLYKLDAMRYNIISRYCLLRARFLFR